MIDLDDPTTKQFLHSGCALLLCTVNADGQPHAGRAWGLTVVDAQAGLIRVLIEVDDPVMVANARAGNLISVTATGVMTFHSLQLKGRAVQVESQLTSADQDKYRQYTDDFLEDIHSTDGYPMSVMRPWAERRLVPCIVEVDTSFDQTPGPSAGSVLDRETR
jgi:hypothetical protein